MPPRREQGSVFRRVTNGRMCEEVGNSVDLDRVLALPRRSTVPDGTALLTAWFRRKGGTMNLLFDQAWALTELLESGPFDGLAGHVEAGGGKTLITFLAPVVVQEKWAKVLPGERVRPVLFVPAALKREKTLTQDVPLYRKHFRIWDFNEDNVVSYQEMGRKSGEDLLQRKMPNLIILDECQWLKNQTSAVGIRTLRYLEKYPKTIVIALSGSLMKEELEDFGHLLRMSLRERSPLPIHDSELSTWGRVLNLHSDDKLRPGALLRLCKNGEGVQAGFRRRLLETHSVIVSREQGTSTGLILREHTLAKPPPAELGTYLGQMAKTWLTPSGDVILNGVEMARRRHEIQLGFFYRWLWPDDKPDLEWLDARKAWRKFVRWCIRRTGSKVVRGLLLDSEKPVKDAIEGGALPDHKGAYAAWKAIEPRCKPKVQAVWVNEFIIDEIERWMDSEKGGGLVWLRQQAILNKLAARGRKTYGASNNAVVYETDTCALSIDAHKEGKNLQKHHWRNLFVDPPPSGLIMEQAIARTDRRGQPKPDVYVDVCLHSIDMWRSLRSAFGESQWIADIVGNRPRLLKATNILPTEKDIILRQLNSNGDPFWAS